MINEEFDDEVGEDEVVVDPEVPAAVEKPKGDFTHVLAGREIWFNAPLPGQFHAWKRFRQSLVPKFEALKVRAAKDPNVEDLRALTRISEKFDLSTLELVESLIVSEDDVEFVQLNMINGKITMRQLDNMLFGASDEPEDDVEPAPKPRKAKPAKKATANAARTKK